MTPPPASPDEIDPLDAQAPEAVDFARPVLERQLAKLEELADIGMEIARDLRRRVAEAAEPDADPDDPAAVSLAFSRVSRAVRMTCALQTEVVDKLRGVGRIEAGEVYLAGLAAEDAARAATAQDAAERRLTARKAEIAKAVTGAIDAAHRDDETDEGYERHVREATERLKDPSDLGDLLSRPFDEVVAQICRELGIPHFPSPWMGEGSGMGVAPCPEEAQQAKPHGTLVPQPARSPPTEPPPPPIPALSPIQGERSEVEASAPYVPPPDPDAPPGYAVGLPGELPPERPGRRPRPSPPQFNFTRGFL